MQTSETYGQNCVHTNYSCEHGRLLSLITTSAVSNISLLYDVIDSKSTHWSIVDSTDVQKYVKAILGPKRKDDCYVILTMVYVIMFLTGLVGNLLTCVVIVKNAFMHTVTNSYLISLASADLLILVLGMYMMRCIIIFFCLLYLTGNNDQYAFFFLKKVI